MFHRSIGSQSILTLRCPRSNGWMRARRNDRLGTRRIWKRRLMKMPFLDRSHYYRGLLVLTRKDRLIDSREREMLLHLGRILDFDPRFCEAAIDDLLKNPHLNEEPYRFSDRGIAECFMHDAIRLALVDGHVAPNELTWLKAVARANGLAEEWLEATIRDIRENKGSVGPPGQFAVENRLK